MHAALLVTSNVVPSSLILVILMMEAIHSSETTVLTRATRLNIAEDDILPVLRIVKPSPANTSLDRPTHTINDTVLKHPVHCVGLSVCSLCACCVWSRGSSVSIVTPKRPDWVWSSPSLLHNGGDYFVWCKAAGA
jgi:hypothetical protein